MRGIILLLLALPSASLASNPVDRYTVSFTDALEQITVHACFHGDLPTRLYRHEDAGRFTDGIYIGKQEVDARSDRWGVYLPAGLEADCLEWRVDITALLRANDYRLGFRVNGDLLLENSLWLWKGPRERPIEVEIRAPEGLTISVPWRRVPGNDGILRYHPDSTPAVWSSRMAIGDFQIESIEVPGATIQLASVGNLNSGQRHRATQWISEALSSVSAVHGMFPQPRAQVVIVPIGRRGEPVPWAHVIRGGGAAVELFIDETRPLEEFRKDWTAPHEFSHLLIPRVSRRDRWFSEGLASYYQNVLLARSGILTPQQAWQRLLDGFDRGRRGADGRTMAEAARAGYGAIMQTYWSGAALMLMADTRLRASSASVQSLDSVLGTLRGCCLENDHTWRAKDLISEMDRHSGTSMFMDLYNELVHNEGFPNIEATLRELGIKSRWGRTNLTEDAPLASVRDAIMAPRLSVFEQAKAQPGGIRR